MTGILSSTLNLILKMYLNGLTLEQISGCCYSEWLRQGYDTGILFNRIDPIEYLPVESKREYWDKANELRPDLDNEGRIKLAKALYYLTILSLNETNSVTQASNQGSDSIQ